MAKGQRIFTTSPALRAPSPNREEVIDGFLPFSVRRRGRGLRLPQQYLKTIPNINCILIYFLLLFNEF